MARRKVNLKSTSTKGAARKSAAKPTTKSAKTEGKPEKRVRVGSPHLTHEVSSSWAGQSKGFNVRKSRTPVAVTEFNSEPERTMTERSNKILGPLKAKYGKNQFVRANMDAKVLSNAIKAGLIKPGRTDESAAVDENLPLTFTEKGVNLSYGS